MKIFWQRPKEFSIRLNSKKLEQLNMPYFYLDLSCFFDVLIIRIRCLEKIKNILIWRKTKLVKSVDQSFIYPRTVW